MHILYTTEAAIPSRASNAMQTMRMCSALAKAGNHVTLVHPRSPQPDLEGFDGDVWQFYGISVPFELVTLPTPAGLVTRSPAWVSRGMRGIVLAPYIGWRAFPHRTPFISYGRSLLGATLADAARRVSRSRSSCRAVMLELHDAPASAGAWRVVSRSDGLVTTTEALKRYVIARCRHLAGRVWVEPAGADITEINPDSLDRDAARRALDLESVRGPVIVYTGRVMEEKGVGVLLDATDRIVDLQPRVLIVGKIYDSRYLHRSTSSELVRFEGFVPPGRTISYLAAADILVLPSTPDLSYARYTSPLKLAEYLASGRPVIAADLPVLREVLEPQRNALLYPPYDSKQLASAIRRLWEDTELASHLAANAVARAKEHSWDERALRVSEYVRAVAAFND